MHVHLNSLTHSPFLPLQSLHAVYPIALYEGKENRAELEADLGWLRPELRRMEQLYCSDTTGMTHRCEFILCADLFALTKVMRGKDGNGTCPCCDGKRAKHTGWSEEATEVWETIPDETLDDSLFGLPLKSCAPCILHLKVRVVGTMLKHMAREAEAAGKSQLDQFEAGVQAMIKTFRVSRKGEKKMNGKLIKLCYVSAIQGEQVDKILNHIRNLDHGLSPEDNLWRPVMDACSQTVMGKVRADKWDELWRLLVKMYDTMNNNVGRVTDEQVQTHAQQAKRFSDLFSGGGVVTGVKTLKDVTPYIHILVTHSTAYLKEFGSLRHLSQEGFEAAHKRTKQFYMKTNMGGGKGGDKGSAHKQVLLKVFRHQLLDVKMATKSVNLNAMDREVRQAVKRARVRKDHAARVRRAETQASYRKRVAARAYQYEMNQSRRVKRRRIVTA